MEETSPTADTKRLEEKHDGWVGVGASSTIAGGREPKDYPLWISITKKRFGIGDHPPPSKSIKKWGHNSSRSI